jgi:DNA polymerase V
MSTVTLLGQASVQFGLALPLFADRVAAGFPSPAADYVEQALDLNELCISRPAATFFVRVSGDSMVDAGIYPHDLLVVDRSLTPQQGDVVIACVNAELTVKELQLTPYVRLLPRNPRYAPIELAPDQELQIFGVVTTVVRQCRRRHS